MRDDRNAPGGRLGRWDVARYAVGWVAVAAASWGSGRTSGVAHVALVLVCALLALYLLYLGAMYVFVAGAAEALNRWAAREESGRPRRRIPAAWRIVVLFWLFGVIGCGLFYWFGLGLRGDEAWWPLGDSSSPASW